MADGKTIEIKIAATDKASPVLAGLNKQVENLSGGGSGQGMRALTAESQKVTAAGVKMGTRMQNVGYQVQDLAVQVGSGTSAFRALGQQMPQLLSGFGPVGIALGTISAVALPLAGALFNMAGATTDVADASEDAAEATINLALSQSENLKIEAQSAERKRELAETTRQITIEQYAYNESLQKTLDLLKETQGAENEIAAAKGQLEIDKAGDDPVRKEQVANEVRKQAQAQELKQMEERRKLASEIIDRKGAQELEVGNAGEAKAKELRDQAANAGAEALQLEQLAKLKKAGPEAKAEAAKDAGNKDYQPGYFDRKLLDEADQAERSAKEARAREKDLGGQAGAVESATAAEVKRLQGEAQKLFDEVNKSKRDAETKQQVFGARDEQGDIKESRAKKKAKYEADKDSSADQTKAEALSQKKRDAGRDLETNITGIGKDAADATRGLGARGINPDGFNTLAAKIAKKGNPEQDKTDLSSFLAKVSMLVDRIPDSKSGSEDAQTLREVELKLEKKIAALTQQIRNK